MHQTTRHIPEGSSVANTINCSGNETRQRTRPTYRAFSLRTSFEEQRQKLFQTFDSCVPNPLPPGRAMRPAVTLFVNCVDFAHQFSRLVSLVLIFTCTAREPAHNNNCASLPKKVGRFCLN